ncbi:uncharacterized protein LOC124641502 isoform X1 [Helicoverpa zea]|uniref:uncharacterized protein LOC124641502 isoform X1 n=1 Tax=Helicoverpa zea TaxID=7113 RepID=UPI001F58846C|nr:uncharacterized protein LOC124641502 isoform X1 [Helicoverpa zea]
MLCEKCNLRILKQKFKNHTRSNLHKSNCLLSTEFESIKIIATAFKNRIVTYRLSPVQEDEHLTPEAFLCYYKNDINRIIELSLAKHKCIKVNFELFAYFILPKSDEQQLKSFNTKFEIVCSSTDINCIIIKIINILVEKMIAFEHCESGWSFFKVNHLEININKYSPMRGGSYLELPSVIKNTKSCINIKNNDKYCLLWSIVASLYPARSNVCRTASYPHFSEVLNIEGIAFPPTINDLKLLEKQNPDLSINVYGLDKKCNVTGPLYLSSLKKVNHINLLYIEKEEKGHYCLIKDLPRLVRRQITKHNGKLEFCDSCLQFFASKTRYNSHKCSKILAILPGENSKLKFKHYERKLKINFIVYADFESILLDCDTKSSDNNTTNIKLHQPSSFGYYVCCSHDSSLNKYVWHRGPDCIEIFIKNLIRDVKRICRILSIKKSLSSLSENQRNNYDMANICHICEQPLLGDKVLDHDHITGEYRGAAHTHCNLTYKVCPFIPVVFHNLSGYDSHIFIKELTNYEGDIKVIPKSKEKYMSITKNIYYEKLSRHIQIKFIDSFQFLSCSLDTLSKSLTKEENIHLASEFRDYDQFVLLREKGVFPYEYIDSWAKYDVKELPPKYTFFNSLTSEHITDAEYQRAQKIWDAFKIDSLGRYNDLYLKSDVLLLCDIFEKFRQMCLKYYKLDPAHYVSSPGLSWDAMLLYTGVQLDLISDLEIYELLENGIRGGLAQCSLRYAKSNNKYLPDYDVTEPSSFLIYLDANNLYGHAMTKKMPISNFYLLNENEISKFDLFNVADDADYGYILEVDLCYPQHLHDSHSDLPFAPEKIIPPGGKTYKLVANLYDKTKYVIHYTNLKQCLKHGLILKKIHRILAFRQDCFLKKYIDLNTQLRQTCNSAFEKDFFKLLNNAIFGKTIENRRKQKDVRLISQWADTKNLTNKNVGAEKLISKPNLKSIYILNENFVVIQLNQEKVTLDRPIYIGFTVLEYAKQHLYQFHYDFIKNKYKNQTMLCYTDTDSLLYYIHTNDFYADITQNISQFDTSNFSEDNPYGIFKRNAKVPGLFKDELGGDVISEFVGLRAKLYCISSVKTHIKKAKGITKHVTRKLSSTNYKTALLNDKTYKHKMMIIKSMKHVLYTQEINKVALNRNDDKRQILPNQIYTLPWGHYQSIK